MPMPYCAVELRLHPDVSFPAFWWKTITVGPWMIGPAWFVWVLLALDVIAALVYRAAPGLVEAIGRLSLASFAKPGLFFWALLIASCIAYLPAGLYFCASRWFAVGPVAVPASRIMLYLVYFFAGVGIGAVPFNKGLLAGDGGLARRWPVWLAGTILTSCCFNTPIYNQHGVPPHVDPQ